MDERDPTGPGQGQRLRREPRACSPNRVEQVVLAAQSPFAARVAADLEHRLAAIVVGTTQIMRSGDGRARFLAGVPLFDGLNGGEVNSVAALMSDRHLDAGEVLIREGEDGREFFVIESGSVDVQVGDHTVRKLVTGDFLGEIALAFGGKRTATAVAAEASEVLVLKHDDSQRAELSSLACARVPE